MTTTKPNKIMLVDDHPVVRHGLSQLIEQNEHLSVCAEAGSACEALSIIGEARPDIIMLDISLGDCNGVSVIKNIRQRHGDIPILVLSMHDENLYAERALRVGANGYIMKDEAATDLIEAIHRVLNGEIHLSKKMLSRLKTSETNKITVPKSKEKYSSIHRLTDRELEVFQLIGRGFKTREVAEKLQICVKTIETHRANIKQKLNLASGIELLQQATWHVEGVDATIANSA